MRTKSRIVWGLLAAVALGSVVAVEYLFYYTKAVRDSKANHRESAVDLGPTTRWLFNSSGDSHNRAKTWAELMPDGAIRIVKNAEKVEAFKVEGYSIGVPALWDSGQTIVRSAAPARNMIERITPLLISSSLYRVPSGSKKCGGFQPRDAVKYTSAEGSVVFYICFKCSDIEVIFCDASGNLVNRKLASMTDARADLASMLLEIFPGDPYLQHKKEEYAEQQAAKSNTRPATRPAW